ncbi:MAG TPA: preprotein translocase subunit SecA [Candidatus Paceibacterota bacterium]|mgnify:CR=1 FL=1|nr:preprotein translocase subunit SecA [Candidatus Paceibacterota bacterium]
MASSFLKFFKNPNQKALDKIKPLVLAINQQEKGLTELTEQEILRRSLELKEKILEQGLNNENLITAFSLVREASKRTLGQRHFDVQLMAGIVLSQGKLAEMKTGEGKTLAATLPAYYYALLGKGVHIVTVNDYLAQRDTIWMGQIYNFLGLKVGCLIHDGALIYDPDYNDSKENQEVNNLDKSRDTLGSFKIFHQFLKPITRKEAYNCDILYATNHEFGFDYLRDNLVYSKEEMVQRPLFYAIIDEVDSILIDEARTPLIIAMPDEDATHLYKEFAAVSRKFNEEDIEIDLKRNSIILTEKGLEKLNRILNRNIYEENDLPMIHHLEEALKAEFLFKRDKNYVVKDGEVIIVDEFTGRLLPGRRYSEGLHQAIEAKEGVRVQQENRTLATITIQNYFRMYPTLAGMSGTIISSAEEFHKVYNLEALAIPTNKPMIRIDLPDKIFLNENAKFKAVVNEIKKRHEKGQPILVGTISIEKNEILSNLLDREGIPHNVLNAKNHEREAEIIAQAGKLKAVTVATNMAGRGVDIILGGNPPDEKESSKIKDLGGLFVLGTERHEALRIDNQLRGRSGRQGDPGSSQFFVSLEDNLFKIFGAEKITAYINNLNPPEDTSLENKFLSNMLDSAQRKVENLNFDLRKHILEYDDVLNKQRQFFYEQRKKILFASKDELKQLITNLINSNSSKLLEFYGDFELLKKFLGQFMELPTDFDSQKEKSKEELSFYLKDCFLKKFEEKFNEEKEDFKLLILRVYDFFWMNHLEEMEGLREAVSLRAYGQSDVLVEYKKESHNLFNQMKSNIDYNSFLAILRII